MLKTYKFIDENPNCELECLPIYDYFLQDGLKHKKELFGKVSDEQYNYAEMSARKRTKDRKKFYLSIRKNGFKPNKDDPIKLFCENGKLMISNGHHRISVLIHLKKPNFGGSIVQFIKNPRARAAEL